MLKHSSTWVALGIAVTSLTTVGCGGNANQPATGNNTTNTASQNATGAARTASTTISETGSSLLYPLFNGQWISGYHKTAPNVRITAASTGSGAGISQAIANAVQIGASDAYMADAQMQANPSVVNIPLAISAQQIMYNLPGLSKMTHLHLSGNVLAKIYMGQVRYWNDAAIRKLNPGVKLPHAQITPVHRSDGSGDTFLFSQFLSDTNSKWNSSLGYSTTISWPAVGGDVGAKGNDGVVQALTSNKYSIGYVGISWLDKATQQGLGYAALQNKSGKFVLPTSATIKAAAAKVNSVPDDERVSLIYATGANSYPIINFEYAIINTRQPAAMATAMKKFLNWAIDPRGGNNAKYLAPVHFLPLPSSVEPKSKAQIKKIGNAAP